MSSPKLDTAYRSPSLFNGEGEMRGRIRTFDWAQTPLGPASSWPQSLRVAVGICLNSRFPMFVWWGPELINIYNDAYAPVLGQRHPAALGQPARTIWADIWPVIGEDVDEVVLRGQAISRERVRFVMERNGYPEETYFTYSHSPIPDDHGGIGGLFQVCSDETARVRAERERDQFAEQRKVALNAAKLGWWHYNPLTKISTWDERYKEIFDVMGYEQPNDEIMTRLHPEDVRGVWAAVEAALDPVAPLPYACEYRIRRRDGELRWVKAHGTVTFDGSGAAKHATSFVGTVEDITDRKLAEEGHRFVIALDDAIRSLNGPEEIMQTALRLLSHHLAVDRAIYADMETDRETMNLSASYNRAMESRSVVERREFSHFGNEILQSMQQNRPFVVPDVESHSPPLGKLAIYRVTEIRSLAWVPLYRGTQFVAAVGVYAKMPRWWKAEEIELIELVAARCWETIERARMTRDLKESERALQAANKRQEWIFALSQSQRQLRCPDAVMHSTAEALGKRLGVNRAGFFRITGGSETLNYGPCWVDGSLEPLTGQGPTAALGSGLNDALCAGRTIVIEDSLKDPRVAQSIFPEIKTRAMIGVPLMRGGRWEATLYLHHASPRKWAAGQIALAEEVAELSWDAVERTGAEAALRNSEERYRSSFNNAAIGIGLVGVDGRWLRFNDTVCKTTGYSREELEGKTLSSLSHPDDEAISSRESRRVLAGEISTYSLETRLFHKQGATVWVLLTVSLICDVTGGPQMFIVIIEDIEKRKRAEGALRESEQRFRAIADVAPVFIWISGSDKLRTWFNKGWLDFVGRKMEQECGNGWMENIHPDDLERCRNVYFESFDLLESFEIEYRMKNYTGEYHWMLDRAVPRFTPDGVFEGFIGGCVDIHDQKTAAEKLECIVAERTGKLQETITELDSFSYSISHDMRAPLRAMQSFASILRAEYADKLDSDGKEFVRRIIAASERMDRLIQDVLVYSRVARSEIQFERIELGSFLHDIIESYPQFTSTNAVIEVVAPLAAVQANQAALTQCLSNLIGNGIKFVAPGTKPVLRIWTEVVAGPLVRIYIKDNGIGIPANAREKIFGIFQQVDSSRGGTGIGLAVVRKAAERMGGSITFQSEVGQGSTFCLELNSGRSL